MARKNKNTATDQTQKKTKSKYRDKKKSEVSNTNREDKGAGRKPLLPEPRTPNQKELVETIRSKTITVVDGPAGTGKTMLAVTEALRAQMNFEVHKIVILRPLVTVGEDLGFLPGGLEEKISPYLQHILEYFEEFINKKTIEGLMKAGVIELVPFALVRGRTFKESFIIVDEAQNATKTQMKAILTRLGEGSKMVVVGDVEQKDIRDKVSGLDDLIGRMSVSEHVGFVEMDNSDIQRHPLLSEIISWYDED